MKKVLALVMVVVMLAALAPMALAASATVNVSVSVDGKLLVAAQPVSVSDLTVSSVLKAAHKAYFKDGESGYAAGIDKTWNMFLITKCWGVTATPYVVVNGAPLGSDPKAPSTADVAPVKAGDNIIICTSSDTNKPATPISLPATVADGKATITATSWTLDFTTFTYKSAPAASMKVVDDKGAALGTTDASGKATVAVPASGIVAINGLAAISVGKAGAAAGGTTGTAAAGDTGSAGNLPKTDGVSASTIIGFAGLALILVGAASIVISKKRTGKSF